MVNVPRTSAKYQYGAAIVVNLLMICYGITCGWTSPNELVLKSEKTPLPSGPVNQSEFSWIVSLLCIGGAVGNIVFGVVAEKCGRKVPLMCLSVPLIASWMLILFAQNVYFLYAARLLSGSIGGGIFVLIPLYLNEIAHDSVRGTLGSMIVLNCNLGMLLSFSFGNYCDYFFTPKFVILLIIIFTVLFYFFPESPSYLMKRNRISDAEKSIKFYQNMDGTSSNYELVQQEISKLKNVFGSIIDENSTKKNPLKMSDFKSKAARKALIIGVMLAALNQFCGCFAMLNYTASIFKESGSNLEPNMSAIVVGAIQLLGSYVATNLVDRAGRKFLFLVSSVGTAAGMICLGLYMHLKTTGVDVSAFNMVPLFSFSFVIFIANWAVLTLPFLVISETLPKRLREFGVSFCMELLWIFAFIMLKYLPFLTETLGMHGSMYLFSGVCLSSAVFIAFVMPETKGKSYDEIMQSLR